MRTLENLEPKAVFDFFKEISSIPHGSRNTKQISDYLVKFAKDRELKYYQDDANNVIIVKEATEGYEKAEPVMIQGHIDMVCEKTPGADIDMEKDALKLAVDGDYLYAEQTTLGGDDGIAVAMALAAMDSSEISHPKLECVFTVDEEIGMLGAEVIDLSVIKAKKMINLDSEEEGIFTVSCAGGVTASAILPIERTSANGVIYKVTVDGLLGGHSGAEIDKEHGSANIIMGRVLNVLSKNVEFVISDLSGGTKDNAICKLSEATIVVKDGNRIALEKKIEDMNKILKHEYQTTDPNVSVSFENLGEGTHKALDADSTYRVITYLINTPTGIQHMSKDIEGLVETSLNLGAMAIKDLEFTATYAVRSSVETRLDYLREKLESLTALLKGKVEYSGAYPGWEYRPDSPLRETCINVFKAQYGKEPSIEAIHAGLECGLFAGKLGGDIDAVSFGPDMSGVHTTEERLSIPSVERTWKLFCEVLKESK